MQNPRIWYFENSMIGIIVGNVERFEVLKNKEGIKFVFRGTGVYNLTNKEDVAGFFKTILRVDDMDE